MTAQTDIPRADIAVWTTFRAYLDEAVKAGQADARVLSTFDEFHDYMRRPIKNYFARMINPNAPLLPVWSCSACGLHTMHQDWCSLPSEGRV